MPSILEYALMAANVYAVKNNVTSIQNTIPIPNGYVQVDQRQTDSIGFSARAYQYKTDSVNEIVIKTKGVRDELVFDVQAHAVMQRERCLTR